MKKLFPLLFAASLMAVSFNSYAQAKAEPLICVGFDEVARDKTDSVLTCHINGEKQKITFRQLYQKGYRLTAIWDSLFFFEKSAR